MPQLKNYQKKLKTLLDKSLIDIILFGSFVKGGVTPKDIDAAFVVKDNPNLDEKKKKLREILKDADIQVIDIESIYSPIWLTLIKEGFSVKKNEYIHKLYNLQPVSLFKYSLKKLNPVQKVQFERGLKKVIGDTGIVLTRSVILVPIRIRNEMLDFFKMWNIYYESREYELLPILRKENFL